VLTFASCGMVSGRVVVLIAYWALRDCVTTPSFGPSGLARDLLFTHGLRRGLYFCAASRLFVDLRLRFFLASDVAT